MFPTTLATVAKLTSSSIAATIAPFPVPQLGNLTATAILGWYAWHTAAKTIPGLVKSFRDEMAAARDEFRTERDAFRQEMLLERQLRHDDNTAIVNALHDLARQFPTAPAPVEPAHALSPHSKQRSDP